MKIIIFMQIQKLNDWTKNTKWSKQMMVLYSYHCTVSQSMSFKFEMLL